MSSIERKERMLELLADKAVFGLNKAEEEELSRLGLAFPELSADLSFEKAAAAFSLSTLESRERMPAELESKIAAEGASIIARKASAAAEEAESVPEASNIIPVTFEKPGFSLTNWLGWGVAAVACLALVANIWLTRNSTQQLTADGQPVKGVESIEPTLGEKRDQLLTSAKDVVRTAWARPGEEEARIGEIVWSDEAQTGYMTFKGLPQNDVNKETYQLWIFDETQDEKTPIDGGVFDIGEGGEVVVPINAKLEVRNPKMFAVTVEKPGGVVVSNREKIVALAKV